MRLIDADALLAEAKRISGPVTGDGWSNFGVYALIERQKTVDAVPVVHAEWKINADGYYPYCSACKKEPPGRCMTARCPNCGAVMDLPEIEETGL